MVSCLFFSPVRKAHRFFSSQKHHFFARIIHLGLGHGDSLKDLVTLHRRTGPTKQLVEDQLQPPLDLVTISQEGGPPLDLVTVSQEGGPPLDLVTISQEGGPPLDLVTVSQEGGPPLDLVTVS